MWKRRGKAVQEQLEIVFNRFGEHRLTDWAAALTYYSVLSIFPGLLALFSMLVLVGHGTADALIETISQLPDTTARSILLGAIEHIENQTTAATTALLVAALTALYSASAYVGAFIRAAGVILGVKETRRFYVTIPLRFGLTLALTGLAVLTAVAIVLTGPIAEQAMQVVGLDLSLSGNWSVIRWPLVGLLFIVALGLLYSLGPDFAEKRWRFATAGSLLAIALWLLASLLFSIYVGNFGRFNKVYGGVAGGAIFLIWLYLSNIAVLIGLELDNELARYRRAHGHGAFSKERFRSDTGESPAVRTDRPE